jgi:hypothetical protein
MFKNKVVYLTIPLFIAFGFWLGHTSKSNTAATDISIKDKTGEVKNEQYIPECEFGLCPKYESYDTDGDSLSESIVLVPTAMTKGAGKVIIIEQGKIVFDSGEAAQMSYELPKEGSGIIISYAKEYDETALKVKTWVKDKYIYKEGKYVLVSPQN